MPKLDTTHPQYEANLDTWQRVNDCVSGQKAVKEAGDTYLPKPNPTDLSEENKARYEAFKKRASYVNFTGRTLSGLVGQVIAKPPTIVLPKPIEDLRDDIDGAGVSLDQQARRCLSLTTSVGRCGLLVDYPTTEGQVKKAQLDSGIIRPTITLYTAISPDLWRTQRRGSKQVLTMLKLKESREIIDPEDKFVSKDEPIYRVLELDEAGNYFQQIWHKVKDGDTNKIEWVEDGPPVYPVDAKGKFLKEIPFQFVGSINNDPDVDPAPMIDIANVNISHYQTSAVYEEAVYWTSSPTLVLGIGKWLPDQFTSANPNGVRMGPLGGIQVGEGGFAQLLQSQPNQEAKVSMDAKESQMAMLGARIMSTTGTQKTAYQSAIENSAETSALSVIAQNVSEAYRSALTWFQAFMTGADGEIEFELNDDFEVARLDAQELTAVVSAWQAGALAKTAVHNYTVRNGLEDREFEEVEDEIDENPAGLELTNANAAAQIGGQFNRGETL